MKAKILFVDDEPNILEGYQRSLRRDYDVTIAVGGAEGLKILREKDGFEVVVSDFKMPEMNGVEFLTKVREQFPDIVRVILTGQAEMSAAIDAINEGNIYRFLNKPCPQDLLRSTLDDCIRQYRLIVSERELLEQTLSGSVSVMVEMLSVASPLAFSSSSRIRSYAAKIAKGLGLEDVWSYEIAAMLSQIGCVSLSKELIQKKYLGEELDRAERRRYEEHPALAKSLLEKIPRLEQVAAMVGNQLKSYRAYGPAELGKPAAIGGQILRATIDFDHLYLKGETIKEALEQITKTPDVYNPDVVEQLAQLDFDPSKRLILKVHVGELTPSMHFVEDVLSTEGTLLVARGQRASMAVIAHLKNFVEEHAIEEPLVVSQ